MAKLTINQTTLTSRTTRSNIVGDAKARIINATPDNRFSLWLQNGASLLANFTGWIFGSLANLTSITFTTGWSWIVGGTIFLFNFNFNASDKELENRIRSLELALVGQLGETFGVTVAWIVFGYVPGLIMLKFNRLMALYILKRVNEEALDEILDELSSFIIFYRNYLLQSAFTSLFIGIRALIKNAANGDSDTLAGGIVERFLKAFPGLETAAKQWGNGDEAWTINQFIEDKIEEIRDDKIREFMEEFIEAFGESGIEAGYVVASALDGWYAQQRLQKDFILGQERALQIDVDRSIDEPWREPLIVAGPQELIKPALVQTLVTEQQLRHRDVGVIVGESILSYAKKLPSPLIMKIFWSDRPDGQPGQISTYVTLNNIDRQKLDWSRIKRASGGDNGRLFGNITLKALMSDNSNITVKSVTLDAGKQLARELAQLTENTIDWATTNQKINEGQLAAYYHEEWIDKAATVYPSHFILINKARVLNNIKEGKLGRRGKVIYQQWKVPLWGQNEPSEFKLMMQELLIVPGVNQF